MAFRWRAPRFETVTVCVTRTLRQAGRDCQGGVVRIGGRPLGSAGGTVYWRQNRAGTAGSPPAGCSPRPRLENGSEGFALPGTDLRDQWGEGQTALPERRHVLVRPPCIVAALDRRGAGDSLAHAADQRHSGASLTSGVARRFSLRVLGGIRRCLARAVRDLIPLLRPPPEREPTPLPPPAPPLSPASRPMPSPAARSR